jgi:hypothetical protein
VYRNAWRTSDEAENAIFSYIDGWYNTERIQKELGWLADEYEAAWHADQLEPSIIPCLPNGSQVINPPSIRGTSPPVGKWPRATFMQHGAGKHRQRSATPHEATLGMEQTLASAKCRYFTFIRQ